MPNYTYTAQDLRTLFDNRDRFSVLPNCQREFVWNDPKQQGLIDSFLRGIPIPPIAYIERFIPLIGIKWDLIDGQQRLETIYRFFRDELATAVKFPPQEGTQPLYPGLRYSQLPKDIQSLFDSYKLPIIMITDVDTIPIGLVFRRWQAGEPLTLAEKLYAYDSVTKDIAKRVVGHRFWATMYHGRTLRRESFQTVIKIIVLETMGTFANLTTRSQVETLVKMISGAADLTDRMTRRFDLLTRLYDGAELTAIGQVVLAYQGIMLLEEAGYVLVSCDAGCLAKWFMRVRHEVQTQQKNGDGNLFMLLERVHHQREFWATAWSGLCDAASKGKRDPKRVANVKDKIELWVKQNGKCAVCGSDLRYQDGIVAHHVIPYAHNGVTTVENMALVHSRKCHEVAPTRFGDMSTN